MAVSKVHAAQRDALIATGDCSDWLYKFVSLDSAGGVIPNVTAQNINVVGVCYETGDIGDPVTFAMAGTGAIVKVVAGSALTVNAKVGSDTQGRAVAATGIGVGVVRKGTTAAGQIAEIYLRPVPAAG